MILRRETLDLATQQQELNAAIQLLREHQVRVTPQRQIILKYLVAHHNHPSVETLFHALEDELPNLSMATVYNTLNLFVDLGIVIALPNDKGGLRYDFYGRPHYHIICENCGKITDVFAPNIAAVEANLNHQTREQTHYLVTSNHVELHGICPECQRKLHIDPEQQGWTQPTK